MLAHVARCDRAEVWRDSGCADTAMWLSELCGISNWVAARWVAAARALEDLPALAAALEDATLCLDKVVELARFASPDTEEGLVSWARRVSLATVRRRADLARSMEGDEAATEDRARYLRGRWHEGGRVYCLQGCFPGDQGAVVEAALGRWAASVPPAAGSGVEGDDEGPLWTGGDADARRADGLVWAASGAAGEPDARRPWPLGGPTELDNLVLVCGFHHKLVHEHGWRVELGEAPGTARWYRPDGTRHEPGPRSRGDPAAVAVGL